MNLRESFNKAKQSARQGGFKKAPVSGMKLNTSAVGGYEPRKKKKKYSESPPETKTTRSNMERMLGI